MTFFLMNRANARKLRDAAKEHGAGEAELAAIERLEQGCAEAVDVERLAPLIKLAGLEAFLNVPTARDVLVQEAELQRLLDERAKLRDQVTALQTRCTELLEEKRRANVDYAVREFHLKFGHAAPSQLTIPDEATIRFRLKLVAEEFLELVEAAFETRWGEAALGAVINARQALHEIIKEFPLRLDLPAFMDATHDLDYVVAGTRVVFGYDGLPGAAEVHRANMDKVPSGDLNKPTKPEGWRPPDIEGVLRAQGWVPAKEPTLKYRGVEMSPEMVRAYAGPAMPPGEALASAPAIREPEPTKKIFWRGREWDPEVLGAFFGPELQAAKINEIFKDWNSPKPPDPPSGILVPNEKLGAALADFMSAWQCAPNYIRAGDTFRQSDVDELIAIFKNFGWRPVTGLGLCTPNTHHDWVLDMPPGEVLASAPPKVWCKCSKCDAREALLYYATSPDRRAAVLHRLLTARPAFFQEAAKALRRLAAKCEAPPAEGECGDMSRPVYEWMAETLEKIT